MCVAARAAEWRIIMNSFNSAMLSLKGGKPKGSVEIYFRDKTKDTAIFCASGQDALVTALNVVTNNQIDALDSIVVYNGKNPIFSTTFRKKER